MEGPIQRAVQSWLATEAEGLLTLKGASHWP